MISNLEKQWKYKMPTAQEVLDRLKAGNQRFVNGNTSLAKPYRIMNALKWQRIKIRLQLY